MPDPITTPEPEAKPETAAAAQQRAVVEDYDLEAPEATPLVLPEKPAAKPVEYPAEQTATLQSAPPAPQEPKHSRYVLAMAADLGIPQAEIDASTPDELNAAVYAANRALHIERQRQSARPEAPKPAPVPDDSLGTFKDGDGTVRPLEESGMYPEVIDLFKSMKRELKELRDHVGTLTQREQVRETESYTDRIDRRLAEIDKSKFGEKSIRETDPDSAEFSRKWAVVSEARRLASLKTDKPTNDQVLRMIDAAAKNLFGAAASGVPSAAPPARTKDPVNGRFTADQQRWLDGGVAKPTHRGNAEEPKGLGRAVNKLRTLIEESDEPTDSAAAAELRDDLPE